MRHRGLLRDIQFASTYPETGRWGDGTALDAAEEVFAADSSALVAQFAAPGPQHPQVLAAVHFVSIACDFAGSTEAGMTWLLEHARLDSSPPAHRALLKAAVRLADPANSWAALKAEPGGLDITTPWERRSRALTRYRNELIRTWDVSLDTVLDSLLHAHHIRALGIDPDSERACRHLARAAALSWRARNEGAIRNKGEKG